MLIIQENQAYIIQLFAMTELDPLEAKSHVTNKARRLPLHRIVKSLLLRHKEIALSLWNSVWHLIVSSRENIFLYIC